MEQEIKKNPGTADNKKAVSTGKKKIKKKIKKKNWIFKVISCIVATYTFSY